MERVSRGEREGIGTDAKERDMARSGIKRTVRGHPAVDGAGVHLVRVLGIRTSKDFDPFLMLDSFDSRDPRDYIKGFPMHPHRGIETITYLVEGDIEHQDSLGNRGSIKSGQSQWMTAGSGILHQEMPQASPRMLGLQIWLNLPAVEKMAEPAYFDIAGDMIASVKDGPATVRVISGEYKGTRGIKPRHVQATLYDVCLPKGEEVAIAPRPGENAFVFLLEGDAVIAGDRIEEKTAVLFEPGGDIAVAAPRDGEARFMFFSGKPLGEPVAWGGPIVMNTDQELEIAFAELEAGTFVKHGTADGR